jgi:very-short-patch-repair endonuclease
MTLGDSGNAADDGVSLPHLTPSASTPTQRSPVEGEGFPLIDRFARPPRIKEGATARARRLRSDPTYTEAKLWKHLRLFDVRVRRQAPIGPYIVDFACLPAKLVIEVDGGIHNLTEVALRDIRRDEWLNAQGYRVLRIPTKRVESEIDSVVAEIEQAITATPPFPTRGKGRGWGGGTMCPIAMRDSVTPPPSEQHRVSPPLSDARASTPSQPFPLEGKG